MTNPLPSSDNVRYITLPPMRFAYSIAVSESPEVEAMAPVKSWLEKENPGRDRPAFRRKYAAAPEQKFARLWLWHMRFRSGTGGNSGTSERNEIRRRPLRNTSAMIDPRIAETPI